VPGAIQGACRGASIFDYHRCPWLPITTLERQRLSLRNVIAAFHGKRRIRSPREEALPAVTAPDQNEAVCGWGGFVGDFKTSGELCTI